VSAVRAVFRHRYRSILFQLSSLYSFFAAHHMHAAPVGGPVSASSALPGQTFLSLARSAVDVLPLPRLMLTASGEVLSREKISSLLWEQLTQSRQGSPRLKPRDRRGPRGSIYTSPALACTHVSGNQKGRKREGPPVCTVFVMTPPNEHTSEGGRDGRGVPYHAESTLSSAQVLKRVLPSNFGGNFQGNQRVFGAPFRQLSTTRVSLSL